MVSCGEVVAAVPDSVCNQLKDIVFCAKSRAASKPERLTQVHLTDLGVGKDFFRSAGGNYRALVDDVRPRAHAQRLADIMVSDQYADAALGELADDALDVQDRERVPGSCVRDRCAARRAAARGALRARPAPSHASRGSP